MDTNEDLERLYRKSLCDIFKVEDSSFDCLDVLHIHGSESSCLLYYQLFFPKTKIIDDSVLLEISVDEKVEVQKSGFKNQSEFELAFNFLEVSYLFIPKGRDLNEKNEQLLASCIRNSWDACLHHRYPGRKFQVQVLDPTVTGSSYGVQFCEIRNTL